MDILHKDSKRYILQDFNLEGSVKSVKETSYYAHEKFGNIVKGKRLIDNFSNSCIHFKFDKIGNLTEENIFDSNDKILYNTLWKFDKQNNFITTIITDNFYPHTATRDTRVRLIYDLNNKLIEKVGNSSSYGSPSYFSRKKYKYNNNGDLIEEKKFNTKGELLSKLTYIFDDKGYLTETNDYDFDDKLLYKVKFNYDNQNNLTEKNEYNIDNQLVTHFFCKYNIWGCLVEETKNHYDSDGVLYNETSKYYSKGNLTEKAEYSFDDLLPDSDVLFIENHNPRHKTKSLIEKWTYKYDNIGNLIEKREYECGGKLKGEWLYKYDNEYLIEKSTLAFTKCYKYDENQNLIQEITDEGEFSGLSKLEYKYNKKGRLIETNEYDYKDKLEEKWRFKFNNNGKLIEKECKQFGFNGISGDFKAWIYKHDNKGNLIEERCMPDSKAFYTKIFKYNNKGNLIEINWYTYDYSDPTPEHKLIYKCTYEYGDGLHRGVLYGIHKSEPVVDKFYRPFDPLSSEYRYDSKGNLTEEVFHHHDHYHHHRSDYLWGNLHKRVYSYNTKGNLVETKEYDFENELLFQSKYECDDKGMAIGGNLIERRDYNFDHKLISRRKYECYDDEKLIANNLSEIVEYHPEYKLFYIRTCKYDNNGKLIEQIEYNSNNKPTNRWTYKYNVKGQLLELQHYLPDEELKVKWTYEYDGKGKLTARHRCRCRQYNQMLKSCEKWIYKYNNKGNVIERNEYHSSDGRLSEKVVYRYDNDNNLIEKIEFPPNRKLNHRYNDLNRKTKSSFDSNGNLTKVRYYDHISYNYYFDEHGNWVRKVQYKNDIPKYIVEREIKYYNQNILNGIKSLWMNLTG